MNLGIVGFGKVGGSFKQAFTYAKVLSRRSGIGYTYDEVESFLEDLEVVLVCVRDDEIEHTASILSAYEVSGKVFLHTSGALTSEVLSSLKERGAFIGSFHPIQTFPKANADYLKGIYFSYEGDEEGYIKALTIAGYLGSKVVRIDPSEKILYHVACVFVSNFTNVCYTIAKELSKLDFEVFYPLARTTLENALSMEPENALTGPAVRGDERTIELHLRSIEDEDIKAIYLSMTNLIRKRLS